jgi:hypothetical protein
MINKQKTYYPNYKSLNFSLWKLHMKHKKFSGDSFGMTNLFLESLSFFGLEKSGFSEFDFIVAGDDPLIALITSLEKVMLGKRVLIYPSQMEEKENQNIKFLLEKRTEFINEAIILYLTEKYELVFDKESMNLNGLLTLLSNRISQFNDDEGNPLCYMYKGRELYSEIKNKEKYNGKQIYWPRKTNLRIGKKWNQPISTLNRYSLLTKEKSNKDINGFILSEKAILTSRTDSGFCDDYYNDPILLGDAYFNIENSSKFNLQHRLTDVLSSMAINKLEKEPKIKNNFNKMYGIPNEK